MVTDFISSLFLKSKSNCGRSYKIKPTPRFSNHAFLSSSQIIEDKREKTTDSRIELPYIAFVLKSNESNSNSISHSSSSIANRGGRWRCFGHFVVAGVIGSERGRRQISKAVWKSRCQMFLKEVVEAWVVMAGDAKVGRRMVIGL